MSAPVWSVVVPTCNRRETLSRVLDLLAPGTQTLDATAYEVIVANDGDFDATEAWLRATHAWARHVRGPQRGPAANRNAGAAVAAGAWLVFTDDDVLPSARWLAEFAAVAEGADVLEGQTTCEAGLTSPLMHSPENNHGGLLWSCNFAVRRALFERIGGFDAAFAYPHMEDADLRERFKAAGALQRWVPSAIVDHPPRPVPPPRRLGAFREAEVRFLYKHGAPRPVASRVLRNLFRSKLTNIRVRPKSIDSVIALGRLAVELWYVARRIGAWEAKYTREFPARESA